MILIICILVLVYLMIGKPVDELLDELKQVDWKAKFAELWEKIKTYALKAGRVATKPILTFYYVMRDAETTTLEKALIYGAIAYIVIPSETCYQGAFWDCWAYWMMLLLLPMFIIRYLKRLL